MAWGSRQPIKAHKPRVPTADTRRVKPPPKVKDLELNTPEHKAWSKAVIERAGYRCEGVDHDPGRPRSGIRLYADHIEERRDGGRLLGLGQALCGSCHSTITLRRRALRMAKRPDAA